MRWRSARSIVLVLVASALYLLLWQTWTDPWTDYSCTTWQFKTRPGEAATADPDRETATCLKCLNISLPRELRCVADPPQRVIEPSWAFKRCLDPETFVKHLLVNVKSRKTVVDVGLLDGALLQFLAKHTNHKLIGFEPNPGAPPNFGAD